MITQRRRTAGIRLIHEDTQVHIDPGPGALVYSNMADLSPQKISGLIVTHGHPDHYSDAEVFIEAMTRGGRDHRGVLAAPRSVLSGNQKVGPSLSRYHREMPERVETLKPGKRFMVGEMAFTAVKAKHSDPDTVGFVLDVPDVGRLGYTSDTGYFPGMEEQYSDLRLLILCTMWPRGMEIQKHLNSDDTLKILIGVEPACSLLTHFGMRMLDAEPKEEALYIEEQSKVPTIAAVDGLTVVLGEEIRFLEPEDGGENRRIE